MKGEKLIAGVLISLAVVLLGGSLGMLGSYYMSVNAQVEESEEEQSVPVVEEVENTLIESEESEKIEKPQVQGLTKDKINMTEIGTVLEGWKKIVEQTSKEILSSQEAGNLLYSLSSEIYRRNLPETYSPTRLKYAIAHSNETDNLLKEILIGQIRYDGETIAYVDVTEVYAKDQAAYQLKLVYEDQQWHFDVTLPR